MNTTHTYEGGLEDSKIVEFKNVAKDILPWLEKVAMENNCRIEKKEWRSKYNSYVVYDYEPFCSDGFEISVSIAAPSHTYLQFINYLYENKIKTIEFLKTCLAT